MPVWLDCPVYLKKALLGNTLSNPEAGGVDAAGALDVSERSAALRPGLSCPLCAGVTAAGVLRTELDFAAGAASLISRNRCLDRADWADFTPLPADRVLAGGLANLGGIMDSLSFALNLFPAS